MKIKNLLQSSSEWVRAEGGGNRIVITSRLRLARNLDKHPFPGWAKKAQRQRVLDEVRPAVAGLKEMSHSIIDDTMDHFKPLEKQVLVEQHLISREHAAKNAGSGLVVNKPRTLSVMINEEDHLRIQVIRSGLQLKQLWRVIDKIDSDLEQNLDFAYNSQIGYLTACPTNVGTGMRASAMLHLPALVLNDDITRVIKAVNKIGLAVRGLYGEGTEALGNLFQISNQMTLGETEAEIIERLTKVIKQIIQTEENARLKLIQEKARTVANEIGRAYGILRNSFSISSKEVLNLLSMLRLGTDLGMLPEEYRGTIDELFMRTQPAHLQQQLESKLSGEERDALRADTMRDKLKDWPPPSTQDLEVTTPGQEEKKEEKD